MSHWVLILAAFIVWIAPALGQNDTPPSPPPSPTAASGPKDTFDRGTPRSSVRGFLEACWSGKHERAANYLDLRRLPPRAREEEGPNLARQLCRVLDRSVWIDPEHLSDAPEGDREDGMPARHETIALIQTKLAPVRVLLERVPREDGVLIWKIASETVAKTPGLHDELGYGQLGEILPASLFEIRFLQIQLWQWIALLGLGILAYLLSLAITAIGFRIARVLARRTRTTFDDNMLDAGISPVRLGLTTLFFYLGSLALALSIRGTMLVNTILEIVGILAGTWLLLRGVDVLARWIEERAANRQALSSLMPLGRRTAKAFLIFLAVLATLQNLGFNVTSLLAGVGIGGLAIALAAQKTVEHLFGGITLIADQPVRVGEFCRYGDQVGTVEDIGLRSTRIRTLDRTVVSIPNAEFASLKIENFSRRDRMRMFTTIGLRYETTPDQLRYVLVEIKKLLASHPRVDPDPARVRFVGFGAHSLDLEIFAYLRTTEMNEFLAIREDIYLRLMDIIAGSGSGFAFPSQTIYAAKDGGLDAEKAAAAEAQVAAWRERNDLWLPTPPPTELAALQGTLEYPAPGSAVR
jgi:MscS family membrane protein